MCQICRGHREAQSKSSKSLRRSPPKAIAMMSPAAVIVGPVNVKPPRTAAGLPETRDVGHLTHQIPPNAKNNKHGENRQPRL